MASVRQAWLVVWLMVISAADAGIQQIMKGISLPLGLLVAWSDVDAGFDIHATVNARTKADTCQQQAGCGD